MDSKKITKAKTTRRVNTSSPKSAKPVRVMYKARGKYKIVDGIG